MRKQNSGWKGESRRHSLARKGIKTSRIDDEGNYHPTPEERRKTIASMVAKGENIGINFQSEFNGRDLDIIESLVHDKIASMVEMGYTSGQLFGQDPDYNGWFEIYFEPEETKDVEIRNEHIAELIREGYTSGHYPTWKFRANVWRDDE